MLSLDKETARKSTSNALVVDASARGMPRRKESVRLLDCVKSTAYSPAARRLPLPVVCREEKLSKCLSACGNMVEPDSVKMPESSLELLQTPSKFFTDQVKRRLDLLPSAEEHREFPPPPVPSRRKRQISLCSEASESGSLVSRLDTSLSALTRKFVELLHTAPNSTIDIKTAVDSLAVPKRRIYDITNVLEGVGMIEKVSKNKLKWRGKLLLNHSRDGSQLGASQMDWMLGQLQNEACNLLDLEKVIDQCIESVKQQFTSVDSQDMSNFTYISDQDLSSIKGLSEDVIIAIRAPPETQLEVPHPEVGAKTFQVWFKSTNGPIDSYVYTPVPAERPSTCSDGMSSSQTSSCTRSGEDRREMSALPLAETATASLTAVSSNKRLEPGVTSTPETPKAVFGVDPKRLPVWDGLAVASRPLTANQRTLTDLSRSDGRDLLLDFELDHSMSDVFTSIDW